MFAQLFNCISISGNELSNFFKQMKNHPYMIQNIVQCAIGVGLVMIKNFWEHVMIVLSS